LENSWKLSDGRRGLFVGEHALFALPEEEVLATLGLIEEVPYTSTALFLLSLGRLDQRLPSPHHTTH